MGVPGKSNALLIARRWGMPEKILNRAYASLKEHDVSAEELMERLNDRKMTLDEMERRIEADRTDLARLKKQYEERVAEIEYQKDKILEAADKRASNLISEAESTSRDLIRRLDEAARSAAHKELGAKRPDIQKIRKGLETRNAKRLSRELESSRFVPKEGVTVQVAGSGIVGVIEYVKNGRARLIAGSMHMDVPVAQLVETQKTVKISTPPTDTSSLKMRESVPSSLMVRGMNVDEALSLTETYLDRAYRAGYSSVMIIHGRGEGILRREVHALCSVLKYVSDYRLGGVGEGGYGVTIVEFGKS